MQDRYAGDVGDFGKLGMLRQISTTGLKIGVNWYLTYKPEEHNNDDGKHIGYLSDKAFENCDDELLDTLRMVVNDNRNIAALEKANLINDAQYYSEILKPGSDKNFKRDVWYNGSLNKLHDSDLIFCDPDNGLIVKSVSLTSSKSDKYITPDELITYYLEGKSIVFYNHRCREKEPIYLQRFAALKQSSQLSDSRWTGLKFVRGTIRDYIFILQPHHFDTVALAIENMLQTEWNKHFSMLSL